MVQPQVTGALTLEAGSQQLLSRPQHQPALSQAQLAGLQLQLAGLQSQQDGIQLHIAGSQLYTTGSISNDLFVTLCSVSRQRDFTAPPLTVQKCSSAIVKLKSLNPAIKKQHKMHFFQTLKNAQIIWDSRSQPKGLLLGHINIRSIVNKTEQMEHLLSESNIDILGISESWLTHSSPSAAVNIPEYNVFRRDRETGRGG